MAADIVSSLRRMMHALRLELPDNVVYDVAKYVDQACRDLGQLRVDLATGKEHVISVQDMAINVQNKLTKEREDLRLVLLAARDVLVWYADDTNYNTQGGIDLDWGARARDMLAQIDSTIHVHPPSMIPPPRMSEVEWLCDCGAVNNPDVLECPACGRKDVVEGELR